MAVRWPASVAAVRYLGIHPRRRTAGFHRADDVFRLFRRSVPRVSDSPRIFPPITTGRSASSSARPSPSSFRRSGTHRRIPTGTTAQAQFLRRLPALMNEVRPVSVAWALLHDVHYFVGPSGSLNQSGMLLTNGSPKPVWDAALEMKAAGTLIQRRPQDIRAAADAVFRHCRSPIFPDDIFAGAGLTRPLPRHPS